MSDYFGIGGIRSWKRPARIIVITVVSQEFMISITETGSVVVLAFVLRVLDAGVIVLRLSRLTPVDECEIWWTAA